VNFDRVYTQSNDEYPTVTVLENDDSFDILRKRKIIIEADEKCKTCGTVLQPRTDGMWCPKCKKIAHRFNVGDDQLDYTIWGLNKGMA
jgi:uncharacterized OB-fold protein